MDVFNYVINMDDEALENYLKLGNVNILDEEGASLLHYAIRYDNEYAFDLLIKSYINVNIIDKSGNTPLMETIIYNKLGYFKRLIREKADLNIVNNIGESPIMVAFNKNREEMAKILYDENVDLNITNENEENIYFSIIKSHNISLLKQMLKSDSKYIYSYNFTKRTLLHQAVMISDYEITKYLLDLGLLANVDDNFGETPLFFAVRNKDLEMIKILIEHGALLGKVNNFFETIYDIASKEVLDYLNYKANNVKYNEYIRKYPLHCAVIYNDYLKAKQLLNKYSVNKKDDYNLLPIDYASKLNHREIYSLLSKYNKK